jgi:hypothetical protein
VKDAQNCFLNCFLPKEIASTIDSHIDEIEMEVLHANWTSEFSHSLCQRRTFPAHRLMPSFQQLGSFCPLNSYRPPRTPAPDDGALIGVEQKGSVHASSRLFSAASVLLEVYIMIFLLMLSHRLLHENLAFDGFFRLLTEAAAVVGRALIVALREPTAATDALIVVGFTYRRITTSSQSYSANLVRNRYTEFILAGSDFLPRMYE